MINLRFTFGKIIVIQPSGCKGNFKKLSIYLSIYLLTKQTFFQLVMNDMRPCFSILQRYQYELNTLFFSIYSHLCCRFLYQIASFLKQEFITCTVQIRSELLMTFPIPVKISYLNRAWFKFPPLGHGRRSYARGLPGGVGKGGEETLRFELIGALRSNYYLQRR